MPNTGTKSAPPTDEPKADIDQPVVNDRLGKSDSRQLYDFSIRIPPATAAITGEGELSLVTRHNKKGGSWKEPPYMC
jgi:hypothetical protein